MHRCVFLPLLLLLLVTPVFAAGNLTLNSTTSGTSVFVNTRILTTIMNLSLNSTGGDANVTGFNLTINGTASIGNVTLVAILNSTGSVIASNTTSTTPSMFVVLIPGGFNVTGGTVKTLLVAVNISSVAPSQTTVNISVNNVTGVFVDTGSNVSSAAGFVNSSSSQIHDVHANVSISPRVVDTFIVNQSFAYTITPTGTDAVQNVSVAIPAGFTLINLTAVERNGMNLTSIVNFTNTTAADRLNVSFIVPSAQVIRLLFTANASTATPGAFSSTLAGSNLSAVATDPVNGNQTTVAPQVLANITSVAASKTAAVVNGSDYWEFALTVNITDAVAGLLQFAMANWTDNSGNNLGLTGCSTYCATLRNSSTFGAPGNISVTNDYNLTAGIPYTTSGVSTVTTYLRMVIPSGTAISSSWFTTYRVSFRQT